MLEEAATMAAGNGSAPVAIGRCRFDQRRRSSATSRWIIEDIGAGGDQAEPNEAQRRRDRLCASRAPARTIGANTSVFFAHWWVGRI